MPTRNLDAHKHAVIPNHPWTAAFIFHHSIAARNALPTIMFWNLPLGVEQGRASQGGNPGALTVPSWMEVGAVKKSVRLPFTANSTVGSGGAGGTPALRGCHSRGRGLLAVEFLDDLLEGVF